ncbi:MAG: biosynthetic-type acetolactate synthase large subunit [Sinimarinibacterium flocculans]|uniref:biosynthetic-type acetolactate synthase large subunit n=1 Tax=Sinimarinibacterium flocculans TaxID=985250 RepID=UPI003C61FD96
MDLNGAELITRHLEAEGLTHVVGIPGGALLPLYRALADSRLVHVLARHEQGAGFIAQGSARASGRAGVCLATSGPGVTNLLTAVADAKADSVPLVAICGQVPRPLIGTDAFQEIRTGHLVDSITKTHFEIRDVSDLVDVLPEAFRIAESGRPGPVVIDVPKDVQTERIKLDRLPEVAPREGAPAPDAQAIAEAAAMIDAARRPVLYLGGGVTRARAQAAAVALAERADIPATTTLMALGTLPHGHPLALGMLGQHGARATNQAIDECDLLIAIGSRFDDRVTGRADRFAPRARVIHIDIDARELGKLRRPDLGIEADAGAALRALADAVRRQTRPQWHTRIATLQREFADTAPVDDPRQPPALIRATAAAIGPDAYVTTDVGQHQMWAAQHYPFTRPERWLTSGGLGTMGFGLPAAIGAALASPQAPVVAFCGDGSILMNLQELATLADLQLDVKLVVLDNAALGLVRQQQNLFYQRRFIGSLYQRPPALCAVAEAFGIPAVDLGLTRDPLPRLREALRQPGPVLIRAPVDTAEQVLPMVPAGAANTEAIC